MERADVYIGLSDRDVEHAAVELIRASEARVQRVTVRTREQQVEFDLDFSGRFPELSADIGGSAIVAALPSVEGSFLHIRPFAKQIRIRRIKIQDGPLKGANLDFIADEVSRVLNRFVDNINGQIAEQRFSLDVGTVVTLTPSTLLAGLRGARDFRGTTITVSATVHRAVPLVDEAGVHVLVQGRLDRSSAATSRPVPQPSVTDSKNTKEAQPRRAFLQEFQARLSSSFGVIPAQRWRTTAIAVSDPFLALAANTVANPLEFGATLDLDKRSQHIDEEVRLHNDWNLNCTPTRDCSMKEIECSQTKECSPGWNCPDCKWYQADCHLRRVACEADKGRFKIQCEAEKKAAKDACEVRKSALRAQCEFEKSAAKAGCEANKEWLKQWDGAHIGNVSGDFDFLGGAGAFVVHNAFLSDDLQSIKLAATLGARGRASARLRFAPVQWGYAVCQAPFAGEVAADLDLLPKRYDLQARLIQQRAEDGRLVLAYEAMPTKIVLRSSVPPVEALTLKNPDFWIRCPLAGVAGITLKEVNQRFRDDLIRQDFEFDIGGTKFDVEVPRFSAEFFGGQVDFEPRRLERSIWYDGQRSK